jgi:LPS sulfotransferase NodH
MVRPRKREAPLAVERESPWEALGEIEEYRALSRIRLEHAVPVREPLVLISQVQRSGGTLLSQLLDGHPECHAHPHELKIGKPMKWDWPPLDLARPETWFEVLFEHNTVSHFLDGYQKPSSEARKRKKKKETSVPYDVFPFTFVPRLQKALFDSCVEATAIESERDVLDCYFTSYFNAWLDNHNLYSGPKKVVTGFTPRLSMELERVERFFAAYPDGTLVSIVRDPRAWYASATSHRKYYRRALEEAIGVWRHSTEAALAADERFGARVVVLTYEELIEEPEATVTALADRVGIAMTPELLVPTFNGLPIRANSIDNVKRYGILPERASAYREKLDGETIARIEELVGDLYERAAALAIQRRTEHAGGTAWES